MTPNGDDAPLKSGRGISRRTVVKAAAWTAPAIVIATASPAAATVSGTMAITAVTGVRSGALGAGIVSFQATFTGTSPGAHTATINFPQVDLVVLGLANWDPDGPQASRVGAGMAPFTSRLKLVATLLYTRPPKSVNVIVSIPGHQPPTPLTATITG